MGMREESEVTYIHATSCLEGQYARQRTQPARTANAVYSLACILKFTLVNFHQLRRNLT